MTKGCSALAVCSQHTRQPLPILLWATLIFQGDHVLDTPLNAPIPEAVIASRAAAREELANRMPSGSAFVRDRQDETNQMRKARTCLACIIRMAVPFLLVYMESVLHMEVQDTVRELLPTLDINRAFIRLCNRCWVLLPPLLARGRTWHLDVIRVKKWETMMSQASWRWASVLHPHLSPTWPTLNKLVPSAGAFLSPATSAHHGARALLQHHSIYLHCTHIAKTCTEYGRHDINQRRGDAGIQQAGQHRFRVI